jgi:hypothetical protein
MKISRAVTFEFIQESFNEMRVLANLQTFCGLRCRIPQEMCTPEFSGGKFCPSLGFFSFFCLEDAGRVISTQ